MPYDVKQVGTPEDPCFSHSIKRRFHLTVRGTGRPARHVADRVEEPAGARTTSARVEASKWTGLGLGREEFYFELLRHKEFERVCP